MFKCLKLFALIAIILAITGQVQSDLVITLPVGNCFESMEPTFENSVMTMRISCCAENTLDNCINELCFDNGDCHCFPGYERKNKRCE
ncbi:hypothetical protein DOY81_012700, partial [Sarcophaga bullata]